MLGPEPVNACMCQQCRVALACAQRRDLQHDLRQSVVQIVAKLAGRRQVFEILIGGADDAHVDWDLLTSSDTLDHALLKKAQQLHLQGERQVTDLVEEERSAMRCLDLAKSLFRRPGEGALLVSEQFAFEERFGYRRTIEGDEPVSMPRRELVQRAGEQLLACAGLAEDQQGGRGRGDFLHRARRSSAFLDHG